MEKKDLFHEFYRIYPRYKDSGLYDALDFEALLRTKQDMMTLSDYDYPAIKALLRFQPYLYHYGTSLPNKQCLGAFLVFFMGILGLS